MHQERTKVICMTPVKNEEWIIDRFLQAASVWADYIIVADQYSSDHTVEICQKYPKVILIRNDAKSFNEEERQKLLIKEARKIPGKKLLVALDADEFLTGNVQCEEWLQMLEAASGTVFRMKWPCIASDFRHYWMTDGDSNLFAVIDDGKPHQGREMHSIRVPMNEESVICDVKQIQVMHFQYTDWARMKCKNLWYQCYERVHHPEKRVTEIYRMYHHMDVHRRKSEIPSDWFKIYRTNGIDLSNQPELKEGYWWEKEIGSFLHDYGKEYFQYIDFPENKNALLTYLRQTQFLWKLRYGKALLRRLDPCVEKILVR